MNTIAQTPAVDHFLSHRKPEMEEVSRNLELESFGIPESVRFSAHLVLILGLLRDQKKSVTLNGFLIPFARLVDEYLPAPPLPAVEVITLAKNAFASNKGRKFRELAVRYQDSARDHLEGRLVNMDRENPV